MCLLTHFMAKTVLRKEFTRSEFYGFWPIWRSEYQYFPLFLVPFESWHKNLQNIQITAWNVPPNSFYGQNRTAKWVYEMQIYGFWPIWRLVYQYFPLFLVPFESWHKNHQNITITAWNVPPNSFYGQNRTSKRVYKKGIHGFWTIWRGIYNFFRFLGPIWSLAQKSTKYHNSSRAITCMPLVVLISTRTVYVIKNNRTISIVISFLKTCQENE